MTNRGILIADRLKSLRVLAKRMLYPEKDPDYDSEELALWLFLYHESSDVLVHCQLLHPIRPENDDNKIVSDSEILGGLGTIGFVLRNGVVEAVADTVEDPRGAVAVQDTLIENYSWCGAPITSAEGKTLGIVSFFPVSQRPPARWSKENIPTIKAMLGSFVRDHHSEFSVLCQLALERESTEILTDVPSSQGVISFREEVGAMVDRIITLGTPFGRLPTVAYLEALPKTDTIGTLRTRDYDCTAPSFLRFNIPQTRLSLIRHLQWSALSVPGLLKESITHLNQEKVQILPLVSRGDSEPHGMFLAAHLRHRASDTVTESLATLYQPWTRLFGNLYYGYYDDSLPVDERFKRRKIGSESAALLFAELTRLILSTSSIAAFKRAADIIPRLIDFIKIQNIPVLEDMAFLSDFLAATHQIVNELKKSRDQIIGLSLWHRLSDWSISKCEGFSEMELEKMKSPGNWRVLQRAVAVDRKDTFDHYKPIDWSAAQDWTVTRKGEREATVSWLDHAVGFSKTDFFFPLDLQLCDDGYTKHLFDLYSSLRFSRSPSGALVLRDLSLLNEDARRLLEGTYKVLAHDEQRLRIVVAGPWDERGITNANNHNTLKALARKELQTILLSDYARKVTESSHKAGITAIMARNASHNIGSHVLARYSMREIGDFPEDESEDQDALLSRLKDWSDDLCDEISDAQLLDRYIQGRMDLVAQVATDWPEWTEPARLVSEIVWGILAQRILLQEIVGSESIGALEWSKSEESEGDWLGQGRGPKGGIRFNCLAVPRLLWQLVEDVNSIEERAKGCDQLLLSEATKDGTGAYRPIVALKNDPLIAIPGGVTGWHALFIIIENLIRNAAKHNRWTGKEGLGIVLEILTERDNRLRVRDLQGDQEVSRPAFLIRLYDDRSRTKVESLVQDMNRALRLSIIDEMGQLLTQNWGLVEMKVAAAYLQRRGMNRLGTLRSPSREGDKENSVTGDLSEMLACGKQGFSVIRAVRSPLGTLGYEFFLLRPTRLGVSNFDPHGSKQ